MPVRIALTVTPAGKAARVYAAIAARFGYQAVLTSLVVQPPIGDPPVIPPPIIVTTPNPETIDKFAERMIEELVLGLVEQHEYDDDVGKVPRRKDIR